MSQLARYIFLSAFGLVSILVFGVATAETARLIAFDASLKPQITNALIVTLLAGIAAIWLASFVRQSIRVFPVMMGRWFQRNKDRLATLMLGFLVCALFVVA